MASAPFAGGLAATHHDMEAASAAEPFDNTDTSATSGDEEDDVSGGSSTSSKLSMKGSDRDLSMTKAAAAAGGSNKKAGMMLGVEGRAPDASDTGGGLLEPVSPGLGVRGKKRERRKISGFKRESPLAYREFLTGHLDATGRDSVYPSTHENDKKKRGAECLRDDATELQILMSAPRVSHIAASVENVPVR
ncbi:uncharacterized protein EV422DRAFT_139600 [Fimicolochytrium jonesii]|uniref:uncharacterized protein n=1 Tax=Fimicolochytrium jonesii TaxID=1396493 RepID=UPI0022FEB83E|nr:uncharacterized protein EV422DRAFT_139600 [Fimicolochytrium jonesii]KAI8825756.1 hypothetical protein EV422DRAFT_139600 [Fimicolochytrium jonesii]